MVARWLVAIMLGIGALNSLIVLMTGGLFLVGGNMNQSVPVAILMWILGAIGVCLIFWFRFYRSREAKKVATQAQTKAEPKKA